MRARPALSGSALINQRFRCSLERKLSLAADEVLRNNRKLFEDHVKKSLMGGQFDGVQYDNVLAPTSLIKLQ